MRILVLVSLVFANIAMASIGNVISFKGSVSINRASQDIRVKLNLPIEKSDVISTKKNSNVIIRFDDQTIITVGKNSALSIEEYLYDEKDSKNSKTQFNFFKGTFKSVTGAIGHLNPDKFRLKTRTANIGIRGTVTLGNDKIIACTKGSIGVKSKGSSVVLKAGQYTSIGIKKPSAPKLLTAKVLAGLNRQLGISADSNSNSKSKTGFKAVTDMVEKSVQDQAKEEGGGDSGSSGSSGSCGQ